MIRAAEQQKETQRRKTQKKELSKVHTEIVGTYFDIKTCKKKKKEKCQYSFPKKKRNYLFS